MQKPILVAACGNPYAADDGFGHAVAESLRTAALPGLTVAELGIRPADLLENAPGYAALIIVDAVCCPGEKPGRLIDVDWFDPARPALKSEAALSTHGLSIGRQLDLGQALGMLPPVVRVVGANIVQVEIGFPMTEAVQRCISNAVNVIRHYAV